MVGSWELLADGVLYSRAVVFCYHVLLMLCALWGFVGGKGGGGGGKRPRRVCVCSCHAWP